MRALDPESCVFWADLELVKAGSCFEAPVAVDRDWKQLWDKHCFYKRGNYEYPDWTWRKKELTGREARWVGVDERRHVQSE